MIHFKPQSAATQSVAQVLRSLEDDIIESFLAEARPLDRKAMMADDVDDLVEFLADQLEPIGFHFLGDEPYVNICDDHGVGRIVVSFLRQLATGLSGVMHITIDLETDDEGVKLSGVAFSGTVVGIFGPQPVTLLEFSHADYRCVLDAAAGQVSAKCPCCCPVSELLPAVDFMFRDAHLRILTGAGVEGVAAQAAAGFTTDHRVLALKVALLIGQVNQATDEEEA